MHPEQNPAMAGQQVYRNREVQDKQIARLLAKVRHCWPFLCQKSCNSHIICIIVFYLHDVLFIQKQRSAGQADCTAAGKIATLLAIFVSKELYFIFHMYFHFFIYHLHDILVIEKQRSAGKADCTAAGKGGTLYVVFVIEEQRGCFIRTKIEKCRTSRLLGKL
jgi:hypothetical protein